MPRLNERRGGFTLMEMLLVLAILVVLMGIVGPRILGAQKKSDVGAAKTQLGVMKGALEQYALDMKDFPQTEQGLQALVEKPAESKQAEDWDGPYLEASELPLDPWKNPYQYAYPPQRGQGRLPDIWSLGPDGEDNTEDDVVNWTAQRAGEVRK